MIKGFTLVEILIITAILVLLIAIPVPAFRFFQGSVNLNNAQDEIISNLNLVESRTLASEEAAQYGIYFDKDNGNYTLFSGSSYQTRDQNYDKTYTLSSAVEIFEINLKLVSNPLESSNEVVFNRITGSSNQTGNLILRLKARPEDTRVIHVLSSGKVVTQVPSVSEVQRKKDSRHVHFDLGWSIQNATILKFKFLSPEPDQIGTIEMANYFNQDKTNFDWSGSFIVNEAEQEFRIHIHSLDASNTILCIHRDRNQNKNNEEVIIYIFDGADKEIAHYFADENATVEKGEIYVRSMEPQ